MTQSPGRDAAGSGSTSMRQERVTACSCQIPAGHAMTSSPSPPAAFVSTVSQLLNAPDWACDTSASAWAFTRHNTCARLTSTASGGDGGDKTGVAGIDDTG